MYSSVCACTASLAPHQAIWSSLTTTHNQLYLCKTRCTIIVDVNLPSLRSYFRMSSLPPASSSTTTADLHHWLILLRQPVYIPVTSSSPPSSSLRRPSRKSARCPRFDVGQVDNSKIPRYNFEYEPLAYPPFIST